MRRPAGADQHPLLQPRPMSAAEVADLVKRARMNQRRAQEESSNRSRETCLRLRESAAPAPGIPTTTRSRCAARYASLVGCSLREAANAFGLLGLEGPRLAWRQMYPGEETACHGETPS